MSTEALTSEPSKVQSDGGPPLVRAGLRGFLDIGRFDVIVYDPPFRRFAPSDASDLSTARLEFAFIA